RLSAGLGRRAAGLRNLALQMLTAHPEAVEQFRDPLRLIAASILVLDLADLPEGEELAPSARSRLRLWIVEAYRSLVTLSVGAVGLFAMQKKWIRVDETVANWISIGLVLWIALS